MQCRFTVPNLLMLHASTHASVSVPDKNKPITMLILVIV